MEYIIVQIAGQPDATANVLINGKHNGETNTLVTLGGPGFVKVSVEKSGAEEKTVNVRNTNHDNPTPVEITCA